MCNDKVLLDSPPYSFFNALCTHIKFHCHSPTQMNFSLSLQGSIVPNLDISRESMELYSQWANLKLKLSTFPTLFSSFSSSRENAM